MTGCPGGSGEIGTTCGGNDDCSSSLQCLNGRCQPRCQRAPDCGDGYSCEDDGSCKPATGGPGDNCSSEVDCAAGLSCQLDKSAAGSDLHLEATCTQENDTAPAGSECVLDADCRNGTCALGHCVDVCQKSRDCGAGYNCAVIPSTVVSHALFEGCLPESGLLTWRIPVDNTTPEVLIPAPTIATSVELVMSVPDPDQKVGATSVMAPNGNRIYARPCSSASGACTEAEEADQFFANAQRHTPGFGQSVLSIPSGSSVGVMTGVYQINLASQNADDSVGTAIPQVTAVVRLDSGVHLELHLFFLDLTDHPCQATIGTDPLNAASAGTAPGFQAYLDEIHTVFDRAAISVGAISYEDILDHPTLDGLDAANAGDLLKLGKYATGINVFFVRTLSPAGIQAFGPNPGPAGLSGTRQSGIVIGLDTLCYRSWTALAHLTAHELARYMGLYHNVENGTPDHPTWHDQIDDDHTGDPSTNLMFFAEPVDPDDQPPPVLSADQREILTRSAVLQGSVVP
ncbi:MAG TPA: hypothetical protein VH165_34715 [Kofleriaceae bacterium]|nr:hypothetical protein [Kofleriaceae bacterium]